MDKPTSHSPLLRFCVLASFVLGLANAVGWVLDVPVLLSLFQHLPRMVPTTASLSLACTASLWLQIARPDWRRGAGALAALAGLAGLLILACYLARTAPHPFVLSHGPMQGATTLPAPLTATMFGLLGLALACLARGRNIVFARSRPWSRCRWPCSTSPATCFATRCCMRCCRAAACRC